jgi:hypothetical protein
MYGVPGGNLAGSRKEESKVQSRFGGEYTVVQHIKKPLLLRELKRFMSEPA